jgi:rhodanese-related sulfurtransferase
MFKDAYNNNHVYGQNLLENFDINNINIIDVREPYEIEICNIPGSLFIPLNTLLKDPNIFINKKETYFIICHTGQRSYYVTDHLTKMGYNVVNIIGGITAVEKYNVPY